MSAVTNTAVPQDGHRGTAVALPRPMSSDVSLYVIAGIVIGAAIVRQAGKALARRELPPVSTQWLMEQKVRDD